MRLNFGGPENTQYQQQFKEYILEGHHPCIMAQTVFKQDDYTLKLYSEMNSAKTINSCLNDISEFLNSFDFDNPNFSSLVIAFPYEQMNTEEEFEIKLWTFLQRLHDQDPAPWDPEVDSDPRSKNFSLSLLGNAFYIVGLHPNSSRLSRKAPFPAIAFNLHWQFEKLRDMGSYPQIRNRIRENDQKLQGNINPMLKDFGEDSEAKQYSGRKVDNSWKCPFHKKR